MSKALIALKEYTEAQELIDGHVLKSTSTLTEEERLSFQDMKNQITKAIAAQPSEEEETSIRYAERTVSIREFIQKKELGFGNFSEIWVVTHKVTKESFALKKIPKKQAADLAKRQHPNVYNEIQMERRALLERLPPTSPFVIRMFHAFQDYEHLYYLMELHDVWSDLWSQLRWKEKNNVMVGCHRSQAKIWIYQLVLALEHLHRHGIVHRDIKSENILLNRHGHLVLIDFGTAKDLVLTDLNGPEFVGTPDFMSPEAVTGDDTKGMVKGKKDQQSSKPNLGPAVWTADLWALSALAYILQTGVTPFWTTSPYLAFLRIQRGLLTRHGGIIHDDCWDFIHKLMQVQPEHRLGAQAFELVPGTDTKNESEQSSVTKIRECGDGYMDLKQHPYLASVHQIYEASSGSRPKTPIPSLRDLCYRAVACMAAQDCEDLDVCDAHPPGDGSRHDLLRLSPMDRQAVLHLLDRQKLLGQEPRLWARCFATPVEARLQAKVRPVTRDVVGLTQMNDDQGKAPHASDAQQFDRKERPVELLSFVQLCSPLFFDKRLTKSSDSSDDNEEERKKHWKLLKKCVARINKIRPKLVVVSSFVSLDDSTRKLLARINESIPVVLHESTTVDEKFFTFWISGIQGLCLSYELAMVGARHNGTPQDDTTTTTTTTTTSVGQSPDKSALDPLKLQKNQWEWTREQLELARMSKHPVFCFVNGPPLATDVGFPLVALKKLARGRTLALFGPASDIRDDDDDKKVRHKLTYAANETVPRTALWKGEEPTDDNDKDDDVSIKSTDSDEDDADAFAMIVESNMSMETGLRWIRVDPIHADEWSYEMEWMEES